MTHEKANSPSQIPSNANLPNASSESADGSDGSEFMGQATSLETDEPAAHPSTGDGNPDHGALPKEKSDELNRLPVKVRPPSPENLWAELSIAFNYLTRFSLSFREEPSPRLIRKSMGWFPLVGAIIGLFGASVDWIMTQMRMPGLITATFAVVAMLWLTRALHEEEFASLINQYGTSVDKESKVGWLKEERSVRYGTLGVILIMIMKIGAIASLADNDVVFQALVASCCWSRALMVVTAAWLRPIHGDPVADHFQQPPGLRVALALGLGAVFTFVALGENTALALLAGAVSGLIVSMIGANHLRGYNGPLLGTLQQVVEITVLGIVLAVQ